MAEEMEVPNDGEHHTEGPYSESLDSSNSHFSITTLLAKPKDPVKGSDIRQNSGCGIQQGTLASREPIQVHA
jgi:hypothetical protein